jgi:amino acid adenylation domain-containing protein
VSSGITSVGSPSPGRVDQQFEVAATRSPNETAIVAPDATLTYRQLDVSADRLAGRLIERGVRPGDIVALVAPRSAAFVVGALGILKADAVYLPIDPTYPSARVEFLLNDSGSRIVVAADNCQEDFGTRREVVAIDLTRPGETHLGLPERKDRGSDAAYVVYTSGSTGEPKGVVLSHVGLANLVRWHTTAFGLTGNDKCTQIASPGFDAAVWEIWPTLAAGATLCVVPEALRADPRGLRDWIVSEQIGISFVPTVLAEELTDLAWPAGTALRYLLTGGGALSRFPASGLPFQLVNNFGLSEATVVSTSGIIFPQNPGSIEAGERRPTIGREIEGVRLHIVDGDLQPVADEVPGELLIGGSSVALGYLNRPELDRERFVVAAFAGGERLYRSGDLVRRRADGEVEFLGRIDEQLSVRGFRVEPGEVSAVLQGHPGVRAAYTVGDQRDGRGGRLVAYVIAGGVEPPTDDDLRGHLAARLPEYMIPAVFVRVERFALTPHGKVDQRALLQYLPEGERTAPREAVDTELVNTESVVASIVGELLGQITVDPQANFFLLGGHSMLGAELITRLEDVFGVELSLRELFDGPSVAEIASTVDQRWKALPAPAASDASMALGRDLDRK